jgi:hypothetical protein
LVAAEGLAQQKELLRIGPQNPAKHDFAAVLPDFLKLRASL